MDFIKENWSQLTVLGGIFLVLTGAYVEWRIQANVSDQVTAIGAVSKNDLALIEKDVETNKEHIQDNKSRHEKLDEKIEKIVDILLED